MGAGRSLVPGAGGGDRIRPREVIAGLAAYPLAARAQQQRAPAGFLTTRSQEEEAADHRAAFLRGARPRIATASATSPPKECPTRWTDPPARSTTASTTFTSSEMHVSPAVRRSAVPPY